VLQSQKVPQKQPAKHFQSSRRAKIQNEHEVRLCNSVIVLKKAAKCLHMQTATNHCRADGENRVFTPFFLASSAAESGETNCAGRTDGKRSTHVLCKNP
jgi:hypothetical protein